MCGIVAGLSEKNILPFLLNGLQRLEYRGYDSCGVAAHTGLDLVRTRSTARVKDLMSQVAHFHGATAASPELTATLGIAHTRWATHGAPSVDNAHPHFSTDAKIAVVHNGIIENHDELRTMLKARGYRFSSQTDTEVIVHLIDSFYEGDLLVAVESALSKLTGAYAIAVMCKAEPFRLVGARSGAPLVVGLTNAATENPSKEIFLASDALALVGVCENVIFLEDGDYVDIKLGSYQIYDRTQAQLAPSERSIRSNQGLTLETDLGPYRHYMQKEIFEQPRTLSDTLEGVLSITPELFKSNGTQSAADVFAEIDQVLILACGSSYYTGCVAKYWLEDVAAIPCSVEIASEYRYRKSVPNARTLVVGISQSGETADTLAALRHAKSLGMHHQLTICNVATSAMVRECPLAFITRAGVEVGVASTKAFTAQLLGLFLLTLTLAKTKNKLTANEEAEYLKDMRHLPLAVQAVLALEPQLMAWSEQFSQKENALFLGRGMHYPIALEGALKLKEISYIHAESYAAGELKHGPLALVTKDMPVLAVAPNDALLEKLKSNLQEVRARGGELYVLADADSRMDANAATDMHLIRMPEHYGLLSPILYVIPLQLLSYHTACHRGTDVDKPRNLAKSVTVE